MRDAGCDVELFYDSRLEVKPCYSGRMYCWPEKPGECCINDDMELLYPIVKDFAEIASVEFVGAVLRLHAFLLKKQGEVIEQGREILNAVQRAGTELIKEGTMRKETPDVINILLISRDEYLQKYK